MDQGRSLGKEASRPTAGQSIRVQVGTIQPLPASLVSVTYVGPRLLDLANKISGLPIRFEFQLNDESFFGSSIPRYCTYT